MLEEIARRLEDALSTRLAEIELQESEARYREIFDNVSDGLTIYDVTEAGRLRYVAMNATAQLRTGLSESHVVGEHLEDVLSPEMLAPLLPHVRRCLMTKQPVYFEHAFERDGRSWYLEVAVVPVLDGVGQVRRLITVYHDITGARVHRIPPSADVG